MVSLGGRHDWADDELEDRLAGATTEQDDNKFTGRAGLIYLADNGLAPYFSYSTSFLPIGGANLAGEQFEPETGQQYEVGVKYRPPGFNSLITLAAFDLTRQNVVTPSLVDPLDRVQTGEVRSRGVEMEALASLYFGLDLSFAYTYLDAEVTQSNVEGEEGNRPTRVPEHLASLWADYTIRTGASAGLGLGGRRSVSRFRVRR